MKKVLTNYSVVTLFGEKWQKVEKIVFLVKNFATLHPKIADGYIFLTVQDNSDDHLLWPFSRKKLTFAQEQKLPIIKLHMYSKTNRWKTFGSFKLFVDQILIFEIHPLFNYCNLQPHHSLRNRLTSFSNNTESIGLISSSSHVWKCLIFTSLLCDYDIILCVRMKSTCKIWVNICKNKREIEKTTYSQRWRKYKILEIRLHARSQKIGNKLL